MTRNGKREVVENAFAEAVHESDPVRGSQINPRLPFFGTGCRRAWGDPDLHQCAPVLTYSTTKSGRLLACGRSAVPPQTHHDGASLNPARSWLAPRGSTMTHDT
jgi:hypothetical protein